MPMEKKKRIDNYIGEIPSESEISQAPNSEFLKGYRTAKIELRNKLYIKEEIPTEEKKPIVNPINDWNPEFNVSLFGKEIYDR
jgi:hypothetical protein